MKTGVRVLDAMTNRPVTAKETDSMKDCAVLMKKYHVGSLLIKDKNKVIAILTEQDMVRRGIAKSMSFDEPVKKIMETELMTINPHVDLYDALIFMREENIRHLPVKEGKKIIGLITLKDILKIEPQLFELLLEKFELREEQTKPIIEATTEEGVCEMCGNYSFRVIEVDGAKKCANCRTHG